MVEITPSVVKRYQADRLREKASPKTINDEVQLLLRLCGEQGVLIRATLRRDKALKLTLPLRPAARIARMKGPDVGGGAEVAYASDVRCIRPRFEYWSPG